MKWIQKSWESEANNLPLGLREYKEKLNQFDKLRIYMYLEEYNFQISTPQRI